MKKTFKRVIQFELNEFSHEILNASLDKANLPNFSRIVQDWQHVETTSEQKYEHLEPWIQWVTAHTGKSYYEHSIFHLGNADKLLHDQIWEVLSDNQIESAIIGSMNATRGRTKGGIFFPDPWSPNGIAFPEKLQPLWQFISNRVQAHSVSSISLIRALQGLKASLGFNIPPHLFGRIIMQIVRQRTDPLKKWMLAGLFDEFLSAIFIDILKETRFGFYTLFLNSIAHYQHHFWRQFNKDIFDQTIKCPDCHSSDDPIIYGLETYDRIIGNIMPLVNSDDTLVLIVTGLSQQPYTSDETVGGMHYYRLNHHRKFIDTLGLENLDIFPLMSRDWQVTSNRNRNIELAYNKLSQLFVNGCPLFAIQKSLDNALFIETAVTQGSSYNSPIFSAEGLNLGPMSRWFTSVAVKSGCHISQGTVWSSSPVLPTGISGTIPLREIYLIGLDALGVKEELTQSKPTSVSISG